MQFKILLKAIVSAVVCCCPLAGWSQTMAECTDGVLLFREDFGGNFPDAPLVSDTPLATMSSRYRQTTVTDFGQMGAGRYIITKSGYANGDTINSFSQWYVQDDHTYPGDYSRGYFLEVDGTGGDDTFYELTMDGLCAGMELYFSAYVTNVHIFGHEKWYRDQGRTIVDPDLTFVIYDATSGQELTRYHTGDILPDAALPGMNDWNKSSAWNRYGVRFTLPQGISTARLAIVNHAPNGVGNDFAIDDIEVRVCIPLASLEAEKPAVCVGKSVRLQAAFEEDFYMTPLVYRWQYAPELPQTDVEWTDLKESSESVYTIDGFAASDIGYYRVLVADEEHIGRPACRSLSEAVYLGVQTQDCDLEEPPLPQPEPDDPSSDSMEADEPCNLHIPAYFTPNQDNARDLWYIEGLACYPDFCLQVYDRHHKLLYQVSHDYQPWNGRYRGHQLRSDDYWYVLRLNDTDVRTGHVTIKR